MLSKQFRERGVAVLRKREIALNSRSLLSTEEREKESETCTGFMSAFLCVRTEGSSRDPNAIAIRVDVPIAGPTVSRSKSLRLVPVIRRHAAISRSLDSRSTRYFFRDVHRPINFVSDVYTRRVHQKR